MDLTMTSWSLNFPLLVQEWALATNPVAATAKRKNLHVITYKRWLLLLYKAPEMDTNLKPLVGETGDNRYYTFSPSHVV